MSKVKMRRSFAPIRMTARPGHVSIAFLATRANFAAPGSPLKMANFRSLPMPQQNGLLRMRAGHRMRSPSTLSSACHTNGCEVRAMGSILQFFKRLGVLPPHECAYGCQLAGIEELSNRVRQILGLEFLDPQRTRTDVNVPGKRHRHIAPVLCRSGKRQLPPGALDCRAETIREGAAGPGGCGPDD